MEKKEFIVMRKITIVDGRRHVTSYTEKELIRCSDCANYYKGHCHSENTIWWERDPDWFCAEGERKEEI